jgi:hypothetical protein
VRFDEKEPQDLRVHAALSLLTAIVLPQKLGYSGTQKPFHSIESRHRETPMAISVSRPRIVDFMAWVLLTIAMIFAVYVRVRLREFPLERDEGEFAYAGQLILQGVPPYKLAYNMKLPGTYIAYAALMAVFGQTTPGIHLGLLAVNLATIVLLYRFVRELFDPLSAGMAAVAYSILSVSPSVLGMAAHATHFVVFFGLAGTWLLWRHLQSGRIWQAFASGVLLGTAFLMKQQGVFLMIFGGAATAAYTVAALADSCRRGTFSPRQMRSLTLNATTYCAGAVLPYLMICLWLWHVGVFEKFWFWTVTYARQYVAEIPLSLAVESFCQNAVGRVLQMNWTVWILALVGSVSLAVGGREKPGLRPFVFGFLACSFLCVCPGFFFRPHYFIVVLPAVTMLAGVGGCALCRLANRWRWAAAANPASEDPNRRKRKGSKRENEADNPVARLGLFAVPAALSVLATLVWPVWSWMDFFFVWPPGLACRVVYSSNPFVECPLIAANLKKNTRPDDTIAVLGSEPEIFFDARRRSATGYIYTYGLMEAQPLAESMQNEMIAEITNSKPRFIIVVDVRFSWLYGPGSKFLIQGWANRYLRENYDVVGIVEQSSGERPIEHWDESGAASVTPQFQWIKNGKGEIVKLGCVGSLAGYQPNLGSECVLWICRRKLGGVFNGRCREPVSGAITGVDSIGGARLQIMPRFLATDLQGSGHGPPSSSGPGHRILSLTHPLRSTL